MATPALTAISTILTKGVDLITNFAARLAVHFLAIVTSITFTSSLSSPYVYSAMAKSILIFSGYIGLICLFPQRFYKSLRDFTPTLIGAGLCLLMIFFSLPWQLMIFWGGLTTWLVRLISKKGEMGWEWSVAPCLFLCLIFTFETADENSQIYSLSIVSMVVLTCAVIADFVYTRHKKRVLSSQFLKQQIKLLQLSLKQYPLTDPLAPAIQTVLDGVKHIEEKRLYTNPVMVVFNENLVPLTAQLKYIEKNNVADAKKEECTQQILARLDTLIKIIELHLPPSNALGVSIPPATVNSMSKQYIYFHEMVRELQQKKASIPQSLHTYIDCLNESTESIMRCMQEDPRDTARGDRFLSRYLPAVIKVVDAYIRITHNTITDTTILKTLTDTEAFLMRLAEIFQKEHRNLLVNDAMDLQTDLATIDALLKIEGR